MRRTTCAGCNRSPLEPILDLGSTPLADYFPSSPAEALRMYPLRLEVCVSCWLVQQTEVVPDSELFGKDYSFFSGTSPSLVTHLESFAEWAKHRFPYESSWHVTEIACNDGTLLEQFARPETSVLGIDPAGPPVKEAQLKGLNVANVPFTHAIAQSIGPTDGLVIANNVLAHVANLDDFVAGISVLVGNRGVFVGEFQYLPDLLVGNAFDMVYHEHRSFLSLMSLETIFWRNDLVIVATIPQPTQGGSMRIVARRRTSSDEAIAGANTPGERGLDSMDAYVGLQGRVDYLRARIRETVRSFTERGKIVAGYAASAKSTTLLNYCDLYANQLRYVVDTTPHKIGKYTPGTNIPIVSPEEEREYQLKPDAYLLLAGNYLGGILRRELNPSAPKFIVPLPTPVVI